MNSEDQLCSVLAHEIGHVVRRHLASRIEQGNIVSIASLGVALAALALGNAKATAALITGSFAAGQSAQLSRITSYNVCYTKLLRQFLALPKYPEGELL